MPNRIVQLASRHRRETGMLGLLFTLMLITTVGTIEAGIDGLFGSKFLTPDNLKNIARTIGIYGIFSIGVGIVIITAGIDLSIGSLMALLGVIFLYFDKLDKCDDIIAGSVPAFNLRKHLLEMIAYMDKKEMKDDAAH